SIVLAPHYSTFSVKSYNGRAKEEAEKYQIQLDSVVDWYQEPGFIQYWKDAINETYESMTETERDNAVLIVSAHSLPEKILQDGEPNKEQIAEKARMISETKRIKKYENGWQSEGSTGEPWI